MEIINTTISKLWNMANPHGFYAAISYAHKSTRGWLPISTLAVW